MEHFKGIWQTEPDVKHLEAYKFITKIKEDLKIQGFKASSRLTHLFTPEMLSYFLMCLHSKMMQEELDQMQFCLGGS